MREKGKKRKEKKILIRVNTDEKRDAEQLSKAEGKNTSEFFRYLLDKYKKEKLLDKHNEVIKRYQKILTELKEVLKCAKKKRS